MPGFHSRRRFLQSTLGGSALVAAGGLAVPEFLLRSALAAPRQGTKILVVVQLSGGNDGLNTVIPYRDPLYRQARPTLAISPAQVIKLNDELGWHPSLADLEKLWQQGDVSIVQGVGYPNPNRSHFRSMDIWHSAQPENPRPNTGWLGRFLDRSSHETLAALHLGGESLPLALVGRRAAAPSLRDPQSLQLRPGVNSQRLRQLALTQQAPNSALEQFVRTGLLTALDASGRISQALKEEPAASPYPSSSLAQKLRTVAALIDAELPTRIYYVSLAGFDTHVKQQGAHAALLQQYAGALAAFAQDLQARGHWDRVVVLTFSEFGRRVRENASAGTDHGTAAPVFLLGGSVRGGLVGDHPSLEDLDAGDLKFHTDFRRIYATLLEKWLGADSQSVLGRRFPALELLQS